MEFRKAEKNSYQGEHSKQLKEARAGIQAAVKVLEQVEILSLEFFSISELEEGCVYAQAAFAFQTKI